MTAPLVSVIVPAYNAAGTLGRTLECLAAQRIDRSYEVIVVDDGSADETVATAEAAGVVVIRGRHAGPGPARNLGVERAGGEILAFTDADCYPRPGWLAAGVAALDAAGLVQGRVVADPQARRGPYDRTVWVLRESGLYETANLFMHRDLLLSLGGFEDWLPARIGKPLAEDVWLGWRARRAGARSVFSEDALVDHAVFKQRPVDYIRERLRLIYFPAMLRKMPELRDTFCHRRLFLSARTARFDLAVACLIAAPALVATTGSALSFGLLSGALPYLLANFERARHWGRFAPRVAIVDAAADAVGLGALLFGSVRARRPVL